MRQMPNFGEKTYQLLRWSERYTKTDMVYLAKGGFWSVLGQAVNALSVLVFAMVVSRYLPKESYGQYKYILSMVALLSTFSLSALGTAVFQSVARGFEGALQEGFWVNLRWNILVFAGAFVLAGYYFALHNTTLAFGILVGGCLSPFLASANLASSFLVAKKDFVRDILFFGVVETVLSVGVMILTIFVTGNPLVLAAAYFLSNTLATLWLYRRVLRIYKPDPKKTDPHMLSYGKHLSFIGILTGIASNIDQIFLFHFVGPVELAIYNFATAIPDQTKGPLKLLDQMIQAQFANRPTKDIRTGMPNKVFWLFIFSLASVSLYILLAPFVYRIFFPNYVDAVLYSQIYALSYLGTALSPANSYLTAKKKIREQYLSNVVPSIIRIIALYVGIVYWGLAGAILSLTLVRLGGVCFTYALYSFSSGSERLGETTS